MEASPSVLTSPSGSFEYTSACSAGSEPQSGSAAVSVNERSSSSSMADGRPVPVPREEPPGLDDDALAERREKVLCIVVRIVAVAHAVSSAADVIGAVLIHGSAPPPASALKTRIILSVPAFIRPKT